MIRWPDDCVWLREEGIHNMAPQDDVDVATGVDADMSGGDEDPGMEKEVGGGWRATGARKADVRTAVARKATDSGSRKTTRGAARKAPRSAPRKTTRSGSKKASGDGRKKMRGGSTSKKRR